MKGHVFSRGPLRLRMLGALLLAAVPLPAAAARASTTQESILQDDDHLIYSSAATVNHTLDVLRSLGVDRVRVTVKWADIAPSTGSRTRPGFDATNPAAYPAVNWAAYDRVVELSYAHGI